jgi:nucleotidyltransferase/DNA polymerase involved in DNA repair
VQVAKVGVVLFVDMDSFYASCEELRKPDLKGKAFVVGTSEENDKMKGVVETASYMAKRAGIRSAMPTMTAFKIKKDIIYVPSDHEYYDSVSAKIMQRLKSYGFKMEMISIDEAALDLGGMDYREAERLGERIKSEIGNSIGLPCTVGISDGKIFAKMVCDDAKPDGLKIVKRENIKEFLEDKDVQRILGVGAKTAERLNAIGIKTIGELAKANPTTLTGAVGSFGLELYALANGRDESKVEDRWKILSIGRERTLDSNTGDLKRIDAMLDELSDEVITEVIKNGFSFKTITVKARYSDFTEKIRGRSLTNYTDSIEVLKKMSHELVRELVEEKSIRKVGVRTSSFTPSKGQKKLF